jgi:hypothetical protein
MATKARRHIHKYYKANLAGVKVWACALPECTHYMPAHMAALVDGKASLCWKCEDRFILNPSNMTEDKPICDECSFDKMREQFNVVTNA